MSFFGELISAVFDRRYQSTSSDDVDARTTSALCNALLSSQGEVSGIALARNVLDRYADMDDEEKIAFFEYMTHELEIEPDKVVISLDAYKKNPGKVTYRAFATAAEPRRQELARRLNQVPGATSKLVTMRKDLLSLVKKHPDLAPLDIDLQHLFSSWFNRGFLVLRPISWHSPADILEKIIAYEAVHAIDSWDDLRLRLKPSDRRCFGFFHPAMADEPLIFVQVALTRGIPDSIQDLLADDRKSINAEAADTAVFYSISNCQIGLSGISFGNSLIKQVVSDLSRELPSIKTFITLSPIPNLNSWLSQTSTDLLKNASEQAVAAHYLIEAKGSDGMPLDPVARFHLGNGALIHAVHANADTSENGLKQSNGTMVNYLYDLSQISANHEQLLTEKTVITSEEVNKLSTSAVNKKSGDKNV
ncbi:MAG: malonyl-CoA decarboxylase [Granulosicoccus sp.]